MSNQVTLALDALRRYRQASTEATAPEIDRAIEMLKRIKRQSRRHQRRTRVAGPLTSTALAQGYELTVDDSGQFLIHQVNPWDAPVVYRLLPAVLRDLEHLLACQGLERIQNLLSRDGRHFTLRLLGPVVLGIDCQCPIPAKEV